jgi:hypothetical protein
MVEYSVIGCGPAPVGGLFLNVPRNVLLTVIAFYFVPAENIFCYIYNSSFTQNFICTVMNKTEGVPTLP